MGASKGNRFAQVLDLFGSVSLSALMGSLRQLGVVTYDPIRSRYRFDREVSAEVMERTFEAARQGYTLDEWERQHG